MEPGASTPPHTDDREEVVVVLAGSGSTSLNGERVDVAPGDVLIVPPGTLHQLFATEGETLDGLAVMPLGTGTFTPDGEELETPGPSKRP
jgi:quercetin dioxygenase-like cupin family protein